MMDENRTTFCCALSIMFICYALHISNIKLPASPGHIMIWNRFMGLQRVVI